MNNKAGTIINLAFQFLAKRRELLLIAALIYFALAIGSGIVNENYTVIIISVVLMFLIFTLLNQKTAFLILIILIPFSYFIKLVIGFIAPAQIASVVGIYKDLLILFLLSSILLVIFVKKKYVFSVHKLHLPVFLYIGYCLISFLTNSPSFMAGLVGLRKMMIFISMYFIVLAIIKNKEDIKIFVNCVLGIGFLAALGAIVQWLFFPELMTIATIASGQKIGANQISGYYLSIGRATSFMESPNVLGFYLAYLGSILIGMLGYIKLNKDSILKFAVYSVLLLTILVALLFSLCRGAWIALFLAISCWGVIKFKHLAKKFAIMAVIFISIFVIIMSTPILKFRMLSSFDSEDWSRQSRINKVFGSYAIRTDNPKNFLFGKGLGSVGAVPEALKSDEIDSNFIDMYYIELYTDVGVIGLGLFLLILYAYFKNLFIIERKIFDPYYKQLLNGLIIATLTFAFSGLFTGIGASFEEASLFWAFIGITLIIQRIGLLSADDGKIYENIAAN
jgi:hypothetical protein